MSRATAYHGVSGKPAIVGRNLFTEEELVMGARGAQWWDALPMSDERRDLHMADFNYKDQAWIRYGSAAYDSPRGYLRDQYYGKHNPHPNFYEWGDTRNYDYYRRYSNG